MIFTGRDTADEPTRFGSVFPLLLVLLLLLVILIAGRHLASQRPSLVPSYLCYSFWKKDSLIDDAVVSP